MTQALDIQQVIKTSTADVSIDDLNKKGFKQVKVLNQSLITRLIGEAVDRVLEDKSREITRGERDKVIKEARSQFETLAKSRLQKERGKIEELEKENASLHGEVETAKKRQAALMESQAARDQALVRVKAVELELGQLKEKLTQQESLLSKKEEEIQGLQRERSSEDARLQKKLSEAEARVAELEGSDRNRGEETGRLKTKLSETEKNLAVVEGELKAKNEELERAAAAAQQGSPNAVSEEVLAALTARLEAMAKPSEVNQIMLSLDTLSRKLSSISPGQGGGGGGQGVNLAAIFERAGEGAVESNISKVKVKQAKTGDVRGALAKLRKLQKGGEDGE